MLPDDNLSSVCRYIYKFKEWLLEKLLHSQGPFKQNKN